MGIDASIYVTMREGCESPRLEQPLFDGFHFAPAREWAPEGATHEVDNGYRYYGPGYPRGPWPTLCGALMLLLNSPDIVKVWYCGDSGHEDSPREVTAWMLSEYTHYFIAHGRREYVGPWPDLEGDR